jgi:hypothetical protein
VLTAIVGLTTFIGYAYGVNPSTSSQQHRYGGSTAITFLATALGLLLA